jgi:hypothetical protein
MSVHIMLVINLVTIASGYTIHVAHLVLTPYKN